MLKLIYAVYDTVAGTIIGSLIMETSDAPAIRAFYDALDPKHNSILSHHPTDFSLKELGNIDDQGNIVGNDTPRTVVTGTAWLAGRTPNPQLSLSEDR